MQIDTQGMEAVDGLWDILLVVDVGGSGEEDLRQSLALHGVHPEVDVIRMLEMKTSGL